MDATCARNSKRVKLNGAWSFTSGALERGRCFVDDTGVKCHIAVDLYLYVQINHLMVVLD